MGTVSERTPGAGQQAEKSAGVSLPHFNCDAGGTNCLNPHANLTDRADKRRCWSPGPQSSPSKDQRARRAQGGCKSRVRTSNIVLEEAKRVAGISNVHRSRSKNWTGPRGCPHSDPSLSPLLPHAACETVAERGTCGLWRHNRRASEFRRAHSSDSPKHQRRRWVQSLTRCGGVRSNAGRSTLVAVPKPRVRGRTPLASRTHPTSILTRGSL